MTKKPKKRDPQRARIYRGLRNWLVAPNPARMRVTKLTAMSPKQCATRARERQAQLAAARIGADPRLA